MFCQTDDSGHKDNQPFFKARVLNKIGVLVSEFCLTIHLEELYLHQKSMEEVAMLLYIPMAILSADISAIPNEEFTVEFIASSGLMGILVMHT